MTISLTTNITVVGLVISYATLHDISVLSNTKRIILELGFYGKTNARVQHIEEIIFNISACLE